MIIVLSSLSNIYSRFGLVYFLYTRCVLWTSNNESNKINKIPCDVRKILFRLSRSLWTTKLSTPVTICMVKYVSTSSIALVIAVSRSKLKEYESQ